MLIADAQVHVWLSARTIISPLWPHRRVSRFSAEDLAAEMQTAGVDRAVLVPAGDDAERHARAAATAFPQRFAVLQTASISDAVDPRWSPEPGTLGLRVGCNTGESQRLVAEGRMDWLWRAAERAGFPVASFLIAGAPHLVGPLAERHPGLRITIAHMGCPRADLGIVDAPAFAHLPDLLELARFPNVAIGASGLSGYVSDAYPYKSLNPVLRRVFDHFGPDRMFWGSDLTRLSSTYRQCVTHFTETLDWLSESDKARIMGKGLCSWLNWPVPA